MEGRVGQEVLWDYLRKHLGETVESFLGNVDFVDKIYGEREAGEYLLRDDPGRAGSIGKTDCTPDSALTTC